MNENKDIEVEVRGRIADDRVSELVAFLESKGVKKKEKNRVLIDYSTFLPNEGIKERTKDIRLRVTNRVPEIIVKIGRWGGNDQRKEISVLAGEGEFDKLVQIFGIIGMKKGILCVRNSRVFEYKDIELSIIEVPGHSHFFEAEKMISDEEKKEDAKNEILAVCKELDLKPFSDNQFFEYVETLNREANEVFEFDNYKDNYFKDRFGL